ncbi:putative porin [Luteimonas aquatica]|uniref:putative porin n=1 Tax=Luteimonas aquatica TaxID=450364 RepID=UPI001F5607EB|nr:putative porin [Luteimonas aquatica]
MPSMPHFSLRTPTSSRLAPLALALLLAAHLAHAQSVPAGVDASRISPQATLKLIDLLVKKGVLTRAEADDMIREAAAATPAVAAAPAPAPAYQTQPGAVVVPYIPEVVREQIKDELRAEVTQQAKEEGWAAPNQLPEWTQRVQLYGDVRVRAESVFNDNGNFNQFPDFGGINAGSGFDVVGFNNPGFINTTKNRGRMRVRARLGVKAQIADWIQADVRLATGSDRSPVSTNQTLGGGGNLSKYALWLDRAYLRLTPIEHLSVDAGRFGNPFWTSELQFDNDLNFDGIAAKYEYMPGADFSPWATVGFFPVFNTDFDFGSTDVNKTSSRDKWLYGGQVGASWKFNDDLSLKLALGYFEYDKFEGKLSTPCVVLSSNYTCDTDLSRPQFQQFGNTLFPIRNIIVNPDLPNSPQLQYYGYASKFGVANLHAALAIDAFDPVRILIEGDVVKNTRYDANRIRALGAVNNLGTDNRYDGGDMGYFLNLTVGQGRIAKAGDWNASVGYRYLESDAVPDAFTDSDFHLGGTNAQGFILGGAYGLARNTWLGLRWLSAKEISGPPYATDVLQIDLNAEF